MTANWRFHFSCTPIAAILDEPLRDAPRNLLRIGPCEDLDGGVLFQVGPFFLGIEPTGDELFAFRETGELVNWMTPLRWAWSRLMPSHVTA